VPVIRLVQAASPRNPVRNAGWTTYGNLAAVYVKTGEYDKAIERARRAIEIYPLYGDAYLSLSRTYAGKGMSGESRRAYEAARRIDPTLK